MSWNYIHCFKGHDRILLVGIHYSERTGKHIFLTEAAEYYNH